MPKIANILHIHLLFNVKSVLLIAIYKLTNAIKAKLKFSKTDQSSFYPFLS